MSIAASVARIAAGVGDDGDYRAVLDRPVEALEFAEKNKAAYVFLDRLVAEKERLPGRLWEEYRRRRVRYRLFLERLRVIDSVLRDHGIEYCIVKTFRPFPNVTEDADVLVLGGNEEYLEAIRLLIETIRPSHVTVGPRSTSMLFPGVNVWVDLYSDVAVSHIVYYPKRLLRGNVVRERIVFMDEEYVFPVPRKEDDTVLIIGHSVVKEQLYTLQDHLTLRVRAMDKSYDWERHLRLSREAGLEAATRLFHDTYHDTEERIMRGRDPVLPRKYPWLRVAEALTVLAAKLPEARIGLVLEAIRMITDRGLAEKVLYQVYQHLVRETY